MMAGNYTSTTDAEKQLHHASVAIVAHTQYQYQSWDSVHTNRVQAHRFPEGSVPVSVYELLIFRRRDAQIKSIPYPYTCFRFTIENETDTSTHFFSIYKI